MGIALFQIDKSGRDVFDKDYSIQMVVNKNIFYGINISQRLKDEIIHLYHTNRLGIKSPEKKSRKLRLKLRIHTAVILKLLYSGIKDLGNVDNIKIEICNDFDGHFHEIKDMVYKNIIKIVPAISSENIVLTKFQKPSIIDKIGKIVSNRLKDDSIKIISPKLDFIELIKIIKK